MHRLDAIERVARLAAEDKGLLDYGYEIIDGKEIAATLDGLDFGRYDAEGLNYVADVLHVLPGDIRYEQLDEAV